MARKDVEQFNLRLNLNNPNHLKIYRTFQDLNTDIHKSRNNFIIERRLTMHRIRDSPIEDVP